MPEGRGRSSFGDIIHVVAVLLVGVAAAIAVCAVVGLLLRDGSFLPLATSAAIVAAVGMVGRHFTRVPEDLNYREGFLTVGLAWTASGIAGAIPLYLSGAFPSLVDAIFESISGFTTTGASVLADVETVPAGILLWRSVTQWLGGMGIIVLGVAVLPYLGVGGMQLFRAEVPGPTKNRLRPRIRDTAKVLWLVYAGLTAVLLLLYLFGGMTVFDAVNHALTTLPTGGFSTRSSSMMDFSPFIQWTAIVFMYLAGINFTLHYRALQRGAGPYWRDSEWRLYSLLIVLAIAFVTVTIHSPGDFVEPTVRTASFQVVSIITTTGYMSADYALWTPVAQIALFLLFFIGGMAGSTAGGPKVVRILLIMKHGFGEMRKYVHPRAVLVTKVAGVPVQADVMLNVFAFMILYVGLFGAGTLVLAGAGLSLVGAAGAAATAISNVGPGLQEVGPTANYAFLPGWGKLVMAVLMLVGRLEIYTVLLLFHPGMWKR
ncbi:MAG TPA: TrkH family potassium uptake protein [Longimicrobiaceae bacterium]|nr:TrkH family potassium uptake protein [Longimicrobiaceae bacterium]